MAAGSAVALLVGSVLGVTQAVRTVINSEVKGIPCSADSLYCYCTTKAAKHLPLLKGSRDFSFPTIVDFHISGPGYAKYEKLLEKDHPEFLAGLQCREQKGPDNSTKSKDIEATPCACNTEHVDERTIQPYRPDVPPQSFGNCLHRPEGAICLEEVEMIRCWNKDKNGNYQKFGYFRPDSEQDAAGFWGPIVSYCEPWKVHSDYKRVWCEWRANVPKGTSKEDLKKKCDAAIAHKGWIEKGQAVYEKQGVCGYNMKMGKCLDRLYSEHIIGKTWFRQLDIPDWMNFR